MLVHATERFEIALLAGLASVARVDHRGAGPERQRQRLKRCVPVIKEFLPGTEGGGLLVGRKRLHFRQQTAAAREPAELADVRPQPRERKRRHRPGRGNRIERQLRFGGTRAIPILHVRLPGLVVQYHQSTVIELVYPVGDHLDLQAADAERRARLARAHHERLALALERQPAQHERLEALLFKRAKARREGVASPLGQLLERHHHRVRHRARDLHLAQRQQPRVTAKLLPECVQGFVQQRAACGRIEPGLRLGERLATEPHMRKRAKRARRLIPEQARTTRQLCAFRKRRGRGIHQRFELAHRLQACGLARHR
jgi:hypothetical protein